MTSKEQTECDLTKTTVEVINAYCRVIELHLKAVEQGASADPPGEMGSMVKRAYNSLAREVEFLTFLRSGGGLTGYERDYPEER